MTTTDANRCAWVWLLGVSVLLSAVSLPQQSWAAPGLVSDINAGGDSTPTALTNLNGVAFFSADDNINGVELWKSDGTGAGTQMVTDINLGGDANPGANTGFVSLNGAIYFDADDGSTGVELWKSDGITVTQVKDIRPGTANSTPSSLVNANGTLFFAANDGTNGVELWKSDGTAANTVMVANINPAGSSSPAALVNVNGTLFFAANDGTTGIELWKSDGTAPNTVLVKDINPAGNSNPTNLASLNGLLFFTANDGSNGAELWRSDGTAAGTVLLSDLRPGTLSSSPGTNTGLVVANGLLFFDANDGTNGRELWRSDGSAAGTVLVMDISPGSSSGDPGANGGLINVNGTLFFDADDGTYGAELWKSDGVVGGSGTAMVKDMVAGGSGSSPSALVNVNGTLFANACDASGCELWTSDGTSAGTVMVMDIQVGAGSSDPQELTNVAGKLFFTADDGTSGVELWELDVCTAIDPLLAGCVPPVALQKCTGKLDKLMRKLISSDHQYAIKNSDAAVKMESYFGEAYQSVALYKFAGKVATMQAKDPTCPPSCFGSGDFVSRAIEIQESVNALAAAVYCDSTSATPQDDGISGFVPVTATQDCENAVMKLAKNLATSLMSCNRKKADATMKGMPFDLGGCQTTIKATFDGKVAGLSGCPACLSANAIRDGIVERINNADSASAYCANSLP